MTNGRREATSIAAAAADRNRSIIDQQRRCRLIDEVSPSLQTPHSTSFFSLPYTSPSFSTRPARNTRQRQWQRNWSIFNTTAAYAVQSVRNTTWLFRTQCILRHEFTHASELETAGSSGLGTIFTLRADELFSKVNYSLTTIPST